ncbi:LysR family transcriptional regulator ArgP [Luteimicrobium subarcticum]|uniref:LysR family transcriptional regulator n=1 Tax=Luteimicrobium subarcticum TaxID=620910 RepID=A0A2M8WUC7_9MICO|nr:LysR family transcriptional regulator ArgP [Luteimicrobium subarcticum]PJI94557.1 LysR family transcriptional regulator [Luteimicrobium subarcticum]
MEWDLAQLRALDAVVTHGTFEAAARALHVTPSAVSQRIKTLEGAAGRVLVRRSRPVTVTDDGRTVLRVARQVALVVAEADRTLGSEPDPDGDVAPSPAPVVVAVAVNADSLATWVLPALAGLGDGVCLDLRREDQDHSLDLLRDGDVMAAVTSEPSPVQGCTVTRLGAMRYLPMASPAFARRWFGSRTAPTVVRERLAVAPVVVFDRKDDLQDAYLRGVAATGRRGERDAVLDPPRHHVPGSTAYAEAVRRGMGWGMLPEQQAADLLARGDLVVLDPAAAHDVTLFWQQWRIRSDALDRVAAAVAAAARSALR